MAQLIAELFYGKQRKGITLMKADSGRWEREGKAYPYFHVYKQELKGIQITYLLLGSYAFAKATLKGGFKFSGSL
jgi:hypothetical protein